MEKHQFVKTELPFNGSLKRQQINYQLDHERMMSMVTQNRDEDAIILCSEEIQDVSYDNYSFNMSKTKQLSSRQINLKQKTEDLSNELTNTFENNTTSENNKQVKVPSSTLHNQNSSNNEDISEENDQRSIGKYKQELIQNQDQQLNENIDKLTDKTSQYDPQSQRQTFDKRNQFLKNDLQVSIHKRKQPEQDFFKQHLVDDSRAESPLVFHQNQQNADRFTFSLQVMMKVKIIANKFMQMLNREKYKMLRKFHFAVVNDAILPRKQTEYYYTKKEAISQHQQQLQQRYLLKKDRYLQFKQFIKKYNLKEIKRYLKMVSEYEFLSFLSESIPLFSPSGWFATLWYVCQAAIILQQFVQIPLFIVFGDLALNLFSDVSTIIFSLQILDIIVQLNMKCYQKGIPINSRFKIFIRYIKQDALIDTLGLIPVIYKFIVYEQAKTTKYNFSDSNHLFLFIYYFKVTHLNKHIKRLEESFQMRNLDQRSFIVQTTQFLKLLCKIIVISHIFCCIWLYLAKYQNMLHPDTSTTWIDKYEISDFGKGLSSLWYEQYLVAFYFCTVTMVTVGYGDIKPNSLIEIFLSIITILISCGVFAYCLNSIGSILRERNKHQEKLKQQILIINKYMSKKSISFDLQYQIREYLEQFPYIFLYYYQIQKYNLFPFIQKFQILNKNKPWWLFFCLIIMFNKQNNQISIFFFQISFSKEKQYFVLISQQKILLH